MFSGASVTKRLRPWEKTFWLHRLLKKVALKPAPEKIPYGNKKNNYLVAYIRPADEVAGIILAETLSYESVELKKVGNSTVPPGEPQLVRLSEIDTAQLEILYFYKTFSIKYHGLRDYYWDRFLCKWWIKCTWLSLSDQFLQKRFNQSTKERDDLLEILKKAVQSHLKRQSEADTIYGPSVTINEIDLFTEVYGQRIWDHPQREYFQIRFGLSIRALVETGDLIDSNNDLSVSGKSLTTIAKSEEENRRHGDMMKNSSRIFWLTVVIALTAVFSLFKGP